MTFLIILPKQVFLHQVESKGYLALMKFLNA